MIIERAETDQWEKFRHIGSMTQTVLLSFRKEQNRTEHGLQRTMRNESNQIRTSVQTRKARIRIQPQESENDYRKRRN
jgi:hypothetical protein